MTTPAAAKRNGAKPAPVVSIAAAAASERRVLPHSIDAEASILGGILLRNDLLSALGELEIDDFYDHRHKVVFAAMRNLEATWRPIDVVTLENEIEKTGKLDAIGGVAFLGELALRVPTADNVLAYADIVRGKSGVRAIMLAAGDVLDRGYDDDASVADLAPRLEAAARASRASQPTTITAPLAIDVAQRDIPAIRSYSTGNLQLDRLLAGGVNTRELLVVCGPPGGCKTAWAISTALEVQRWIPVLYASTELEQHELMARLAANRLGKPWSVIRRLARDERADVVEVLDGIQIRLLGADAMPRGGDQALAMIEREANAIAAACNVSPLVIVDYLQDLARGAERDLRSRIGDIATTLRAMAQRLDAPAIAVSSIGRTFYSPKKAAEFREADDPTVYLAAAKESGDVDYAAARVLFIDAEDDRDKPERAVRIAVAKSRDGRVGFAGARVVAETGRFLFAPESVGELSASGRAISDTGAEASADDAKMLEVVRRMHAAGEGELCTLSHLRTGKGLGKDRAKNALERLEQRGRLRSVEIEREEGGKKKLREIYEPVPEAKP